ncbi:MAG: shikimate dehydrogenase [Muribaculaceae bacterium]|nr:shikimate dehydrogenase [Muribaculaceae bacterium]
MRLYGLIGYPLGHSRSAEIWNGRFAREGIDAEYALYELPSVSDIMPLTEGTPLLCGFNVTIPYKKSVIPFLSTLSPEAREAGAVNTVKIERGGDGSLSLHGYNTDITGFMRAVRPLIEDVPHDKRKALVLGTGGASGAVCVGLRNLGWEVTVVSRRRGDGVVAYSELTPEVVDGCGMVVNATPAGMAPHIMASPPFPYEYLHPGQVCFDLVYNPENTLFMRIAAAHGCRVKNGLAMLEYQAEEARKIWNI